jgi:hypothetical protein
VSTLFQPLNGTDDGAAANVRQLGYPSKAGEGIERPHVEMEGNNTRYRDVAHFLFWISQNLIDESLAKRL